MTTVRRIVDENSMADLQTRMRGRLTAPGDAAYEEVRSVWNGMINRRPALIARCLGTADVIAAVGFAREHDIAISIKGGGHNIAGLAVADGALMLDMSLMRGVWVDGAGRKAHAQAGCLLGDVDRETQLHGLAAPLGFVSNTGIAGLTLGGGFGYLTRRYGWTCDNVVAFEVVTAEGQLVRASEAENEDLFWGLRGGGGNFGVVVGFEYQLYEIGPEIVGGAIAWPAEQAPLILDLFRKMTADAPQELTCVLGLRKAPPAPWLRQDIHGKDIVALFICYTGPIDEGERWIDPIKRTGSPVGDVVQRRTYLSQQSLIDATQPNGRRYYWKSEYLGGHDREMLDIAVKQAAMMPSPHSAILVFPFDGQLNRLPDDHSPMGNRDAVSVFNVAASWERPSDDAMNIEWARAAWQALRKFSTGGTYVNFLTEDETGERVDQAYGRHLERLAAIKRKWDPTNFFRVNKNILPGRA